MCSKNLLRQSKGVLALAAVFAGLSIACPRAGAWSEGSALPDLGKTLGTDQTPALQGKVVLIDFWASWCGPCKKSFPGLDGLQKKYGDRGLVVIGLNVDEKESAMKDFLAAHPVSFTILRDAEQKLIAEAGVESMPSSFLVDRKGRIRYLHKGFHGESTLKGYEEQIEALLKEP